MPQKLTYDQVHKVFEDGGCELLSEKYKNNNTKMRYKCCCESISEICLNNFQQGKRCMKCSGNKKYTYEEVKKIFKEAKCELLEKRYKNSSTKIKYRCSCGEINQAKFNHFRQGHRCNKCGIEKISGKNNYNYNYFKTDEERINQRNYPEYQKCASSSS